MRQLFKEPSRTYKTYKNAKKVIDALIDGNYAWQIAVTEEGRFFPVIFASQEKDNLSHFYFINRGCCIQFI